jgi:hypothetical protein
VRETPLAALDARTLALIDEAAAALIDASTRPVGVARTPRPPRTRARGGRRAGGPTAAGASEIEVPVPAVVESGRAAPGADAPASGGFAGRLHAAHRTGARRAARDGISGFGGLEDMVEPVALAGDLPSVTADEAMGIVPVERLLYRGHAALTRARDVRDQLRGTAGLPDPELLAELYDLLDLAATD